MIDAGKLRGLLDYLPSLGTFIWRKRPDATKTWNTRFANRIAGARRPDGYVIIAINGKRYHAHRLAWLWVYGEWPKGQLDHANGSKADNRISNLRLATVSQNIANTRTRIDNAAGIKGIHFDKRRNKWLAQICKDGQRYYLGRYKSSNEARAVYARKAVELFGPFARID